MASQPVKQNMIAKLALLAAEQGVPFPDSDSPEPAAQAYLCAYMAQGGKLSRLATSLGVSRWLLDLWIREEPERHQAYTRARALGADALVDEGGDLLDKADRDTIAVANARAGWRKWLASKYDPQTYGDQQQPTIQVGSLHLHALQSPRPLPLLGGGAFLPQTPPSNGSLDSGGEGGYPTATEGVRPGEIVVEAPLESGEEKA